MKAAALEKGDLMHKMLEIYYSLSYNRVRAESDTWKLICEDLKTDALKLALELTKREEIIKFAIQVAPIFTAKMDLAPDESDADIYQFQEYCNYYEYEAWNVLAVEEVASKILFDSPQVRIIYNGKMDIIAEKGTMIAPWDHKTSSRRSESTSLSNQFIGYAYLLGLNNVVVNKIGFQKSLKPGERFTRDILTIPGSRIAEWADNTIQWVFKLIDSIDEDNWPMNLTSCDKYSGCIFKKICESEPINRLYRIEKDYKIGDKWDVAKILEGA
jgi:hypothetical protein